MCEAAETKWRKDNVSMGRVHTRLKGKWSEGMQWKAARGDGRARSDPQEGTGSVLRNGGDDYCCG